ncbi:hypothetical protein Pfo_024412 [Paulownia fortunei]|nr:hypothetical protein Pfo_024412 [Paulownia fortunei]
MECSIKGEKIQAMKNYKRAKFLCIFTLYSLISLITCFFFSYPFWFPSMKHFLSLLPNNTSFFLNAKCFFIAGNLIVFILIGESKLKRSSRSSSASDIYDEYVARSRRSYDTVNPKEINGSMKSLNIEEKSHGNKEKIYHEEKKKEMRVCKSEVWNKSEIVRRERTKGKQEEQLYVPREELTQRVEAFIARVNKQRLLEAKLVDHSRG